MVNWIWPLDEQGNAALVASFVIGCTPVIGLQLLSGTVARTLAGLVRPGHRPERPYNLAQIDGMTPWYEARLLQLGIEDLNSLGSANLVDLVPQARVPVGRLVDWVDQTILYLHLEPAAVMGEPSARERLRKLGIRTATELEAALRSPAAGEAVTPENMRFALGMSTEAIRSILAVFAADPQLEHVRSWRRDG